MRRTLLLSAFAVSSLAFAEEQKPKPAEAAKPAEKEAPAKPDPLEPIKAETAKLVAERERIAAQIALEQTKLDEKLAPRKRALAELLQHCPGLGDEELGVAPSRGGEA